MSQFRHGRRCRVMIGKEIIRNSGKTRGSNGSEVLHFEDLTVMPVEVSFAPDRQVIQTGYKTGTAQPIVEESCLGMYDGTGEIRGLLSSDYEVLLRAAMHQSTAPYAFADPAPDDGDTYVIIRLWDDDTGTPGTYLADVATGCRFEPLDLGGAQGSALDFVAAFRLSDYQEQVKIDITGEDPGVVLPECDTIFQFQDVIAYTGSIGENTRISQFRLRFGAAYAEDTHVYANSPTRVRDLISGWEGELSFTSLYKGEHIETNIMTTKMVSKLDKVHIQLVNDKKIWDFRFGAVVQDLQPLDPALDRYETNATLKMVFSDAIQEALEIHVANNT